MPWIAPGEGVSLGGIPLPAPDRTHEDRPGLRQSFFIFEFLTFSSAMVLDLLLLSACIISGLARARISK